MAPKGSQTSAKTEPRPQGGQTSAKKESVFTEKASLWNLCAQDVIHMEPLMPEMLPRFLTKTKPFPEPPWTWEPAFRLRRRDWIVGRTPPKSNRNRREDEQRTNTPMI